MKPLHPSSTPGLLLDSRGQRDETTTTREALTRLPPSFWGGVAVGSILSVPLLLLLLLLILLLLPPLLMSSSPLSRFTTPSGLVESGCKAGEVVHVAEEQAMKQGAADARDARAPPRLGANTGQKEEGAQGLSPAQLFHMWSATYRVEEKARRSLKLSKQLREAGKTSSSLDDPHVDKAPCAPLPAPHLECCDCLTALRKQQEERGPNGEDPPWLTPQPHPPPHPHPQHQSYPRPPWVRRSAADNLPLTHQVQADIWRHQFPAHRCQDPSTRFLLTWWDGPENHGMGSHFHLMTGMLGLALQHGRILTILKATYTRADHPGCTGENKGSLDCYFFPITSKECSDRASAEFQRLTSKGQKQGNTNRAQRTGGSLPVYTRQHLVRIGNISELMASPERMLVVSPRLFSIPKFSKILPKLWPDPVLLTNSSIAIGRDPPLPYAHRNQLRVSGWRSQGIRFLLRWPSTYLCNLVNFARHQTYGLEVAERVLSGRVPLGAYQNAPAHPLSRLSCHRHATCVQAVSFSLSKVLYSVGFSRGINANAGIDTSLWRLPRNAVGALRSEQEEVEVFLPRPIVRVHIRGSDKRSEMDLLGFESYKEAMEQLRSSALPGVDKVWLSSEEQWVFDNASTLSNWTVHAVDMERKHSTSGQPLDQWQFAQSFGLRDYVEASLCNLLIGSTADGFVFTLASNWGRLSNELRVTGGRLHSPFVILNQGEY